MAHEGAWEVPLPHVASTTSLGSHKACAQHGAITAPIYLPRVEFGQGGMD